MHKAPLVLLMLACAGSAQADAIAQSIQVPPPVRTEEPSKPTTEPQPSPSIAKKPSPVLGKWDASIYGFVELDGIQDSTQSFNDLAGNNKLARPDSYAGDHPRSTGSMRNTRLGFRFSSPEYNGIRATGLLETDFIGNEPSIASSSEGSYFTSPVLRIRHAWLKLENPFVEVLIGQNWQLFGWQPYFHPNTVDLQGVPGQIYSRTPQIRLSRMFKSEPVNVELAVAGSRAAQRDGGVPDGQAGLRVLLNDWKGVHTLGGTGTSVDAAAVGVSGVVRKFDLAPTAKNAAPSADFSSTGWGVSFDGFIPVIPAHGDDRSNSLSLTGSFARGEGIADMYTGLSFGLPAITAGGYIDPGMVVQGATGQPLDVQMRSWIVGVQYYLPNSGNVWVAVNFSRVDFINADALAPASKSVFKKSEWADVNIFWDLTPAVRLGAEYARFEQTFVDDVKAFDNRYQLSAYYLF